MLNHYVEIINSSFLNNLLNELTLLSTSVFLVGFASFINSKNFLNLLVSTEVVMLGGNFHMISSSFLWGNYDGQFYAFCILALTAAESVVGLSILVLLYRTKGSIVFDELSTLKES